MNTTQAEQRASVLRELASRLGYASRHAKKVLSESALVRFVGPIEDVLSDIGDELVHLVQSFGIATAPDFVREEISLMVALASPAVDGDRKNDGVSIGGPPPPPPPCPITHTIGNHAVLSMSSFPSMPAGIQCGGLETFNSNLYQSAVCIEGQSCSWCGLWMPLVTSARLTSLPNRMPRSSGNHEEQVDNVSPPSATDEDRSGASDEVLVSDVGAPLRATHCVGVDVADRQCQTLGAPVNQSPQMPRLEFSTIRDIGAAVGCSWDLALLLQPYLALAVELNGGSVSTFTP